MADTWTAPLSDSMPDICACLPPLDPPPAVPIWNPDKPFHEFQSENLKKGITDHSRLADQINPVSRFNAWLVTCPVVSRFVLCGYYMRIKFSITGAMIDCCNRRLDVTEPGFWAPCSLWRFDVCLLCQCPPSWWCQAGLYVNWSVPFWICGTELKSGIATLWLNLELLIWDWIWNC